MTDATAFALFREGALFGLLGGVLLCLALQEVVREFKRWRRQLARDRMRLMRCEVDECVDERGHRGPCSIVEYD